jgi:hypothetical protein
VFVDMHVSNSRGGVPGSKKSFAPCCDTAEVVVAADVRGLDWTERTPLQYMLAVHAGHVELPSENGSKCPRDRRKAGEEYNIS